jgi:hypothetical protein
MDETSAARYRALVQVETQGTSVRAIEARR